MDYNIIPSPCYVIEKERLIQNLQKIDLLQQLAGVEVICALKANANFFLFPIIRKYVPNATASSVNEARLVFEEFGVKAHACVPVVKPNEIEEYNKYCSHLTFNSLNQYRGMQHLLADEISIGLRVNPGYSEVKTDLYNPALAHGRLGIRKEELTELPKNVKGLHFHALCENNSYSLENVLNAFEASFGHFLNEIEWVNFGGGHLITEENYDVEHAVNVLTRFKNKYPHLHVILEPGSAFNWRTGFLRATAVDVIQRKDFDIAMLDVSFTAHMPDCLEMPYQPLLDCEYDESQARETILGGNTCLAGDFIREFYLKEPLKDNDPVIFKDMIHYTMVKTSKFNGVEHPSMGIIDEKGNFQVLRSFHYQDFKSLMG